MKKGKNALFWIFILAAMTLNIINIVLLFCGLVKNSLPLTALALSLAALVMGNSNKGTEKKTGKRESHDSRQEHTTERKEDCP